MSVDPGEVLEAAREAFRQKEYSAALEKYQWFYDNSIQIKESYYGVRLSYCLDEWAQLGAEYPPAMDALQRLEAESLANFKRTYAKKAFHEYASVARYLNHQEETFNQFHLLHESNHPIAKEVFAFVYDYCANHQMWEICRAYLGDGKKQYEQIMEMFDHIVELSKKKEGEVAASLYRHAVEGIERDMLRLLSMLNAVNARDEYKLTLSTLEADLTERKASDLFGAISNKAPSTI